MSFANSQTAWLEWCVIVHFPTNPPVSTTIDVHESGDIPILLSLPQMMNLGLDFKLRPGYVNITCEALGYHNETLPFTDTKHVALDLSRVRGKINITPLKKNTDNEAEQSFATAESSTVAPDTDQELSDSE